MKDVEQKRQLLRSKLQANTQRNARISYLAALPSSLCDYLQTCQVVFSPELDDLLPYLGLTETNAHQNRLDVPGYEYRQFSWVNQVFDVVTNFGSDYDDALAWFYPGSECPLFVTTFGWVRQRIEFLFSVRFVKSRGNGESNYSPERLGVITTDFAAGIVIDNYCGYLSPEPNPEEVVYEVATWKAQR